MSKVFYDRFIILTEIECEINQKSLSPSEKEELWALIDEIIHHRILGCVLDTLSAHHHHDFLTRFHQAPHDEGLIEYLKEKTGTNIETLLHKEVAVVTNELLEEFRGKKTEKKRFLSAKKVRKQNPQEKSTRQKKKVNQR